ncbi:hypothetical protein FXO37_01930 [Capsicum annuum]|nr:hypothetical protein FXO37_01930 [Capsicum annuum]
MASWNEHELGGWKSYLDDPCPYCDGPHFWQDCRYAPWIEICAPYPSYREYACSLCGGQDGRWSDCPNAPAPYCTNQNSSSSFEFDSSYGQKKEEQSTRKSGIEAKFQ